MITLLQAIAIVTSLHVCRCIFDLFYIKSDDNGETWEKHVIFDNPLSEAMADLENALFDTTYTIDNSGSIAIDNDGNARCLGYCTLYERRSWRNLKWFPFVNGISYWNETLGELPAHQLTRYLPSNPSIYSTMVLLVGWTPTWMVMEP